MKNIFKWVYLIGMLVAIVAALAKFSPDWLTWLLILVGILVGIFYTDSADVVNQGIRYLVLAAVAASMDKLLAVGTYLTTIFTAVVVFLGPIVLTTLVVWFVKKYILSMK